MWKLKISFIGGIVLAIVTTGAALGESANYRMQGCRSFAKQDNDSRYAFAGGLCSGMIEALMGVAPVLRFCPPPGATVGQGALVVVQYLDTRPARLNEDFEALAIEALRSAWSCPTAPR
jgi:hypothetical protein